MKFQKINYSIIGRFENGSKYGIVTRQKVTGYTADGLDGVAIRKRGGFWYVDHVSTGLGVVTVGSKTRDAAAKEYTERFKSMVESKPADFFKNAVETFEKAPLESDVATWEMVNFCTTRNYRFDKVTTAARRAGLITKKADDVSYLDGGNINIIGTPEALEPIREMIKAWAEKDAAETVQDERPENISSETTDAAKTENAPVYTFSETTLACKGVTFPVEYNIISDGSVLAFVILDVEPSGYRHKQKIVIRPNEPEYAAALDAAKAAAASGKRPETISTGYRKITTPDGSMIEKAETIQEEPEAPAAETIQEEPEAPAAETVQEEPEKAARDPKQARGPVPEKTFIGETIQGNGWKILFDGATNRTRVIFDKAPTAAAKAATENAGFYYSSAMNSWNKKLTFKAYRAAKTLSGQLSELYAA